MNADIRRRIEGSSLLFFDGTLWRDDEMITPASAARRTTHGPSQHVRTDGSMALLAATALGRRIFIHINNSNTACWRIRRSARPSRAPAGKSPMTAWRSNCEPVAVPAELEARLRAVGAARYHNRHPFHGLLHGGKLQRPRFRPGR